MFTSAFWKMAVERAVKTVAQALVAVFAASQFDWFSADWQAILGTAATAGVLSVLMSVASVGAGDKGTPSLVSEPAQGYTGP